MIGPKWSLLSTCAHEGRPGHHTQAQGLLERFRDTCGGVITWLDGLQLYMAFVEGWALYAEYPLVAKETDVYDNRHLEKYGLMKWQVWRALRLIVDVGLHYKDMSRVKAKDYFVKYAWDEGSSPLSYLDEAIGVYISCTKNKDQTGCDVILNPPLRPEGAGDDNGVEGDTEYYYDPPQPARGVLYF
ncbi:hypothetical protein QZH41_006132 [Actinostola sp. cb2023]|nr:hypothetical protein QZH41_006132 [Actinostola sp. cb2023]